MEISRKIEVEKVIGSVTRALYAGRYEEGLLELAFFWDYRQPSEEPCADGFSQRESAELLYLCGVLFGYYAFSQINKQEIAKDLLTHSVRLFEELGDSFKQSDCANFLAISYQRLGATDEAKAWLATAYEKNENRNDIFLHSVIVDSLICFSEKTFEKTIDLLEKNERYFFNTKNIYLKANFFIHRGLARHNLGLPDELKDFLLARQFFIRLGNKKNLVTIENNIAYTYKDRRDWSNAYKHALESLRLAQTDGDERQIGSILDTLAQIAFDACQFDLALKYADEAIVILSNTDAHEHLIEAFETKIRTLYHFNEVEEALTVFARAMELARRVASSALCQRLTKNFAKLLKSENFLEVFIESEDFTGFKSFDLQLPEHLSKNNIVIVQITGDNFEPIGIGRGFYAVFEKTADVLDGELVAVLDTEFDQITIGYAEFHADKISLYQGNNSRISINISGEYVVLGRMIGFFGDDGEQSKFNLL